MKLLEELQARGFIHQTTCESLGDFLEQKQTVYHGIDPSADSAQVGNFAVWMFLKHLAKAGHKIIFLVGGGTGLIGDPKPDAERTLTNLEEVALRTSKLKVQAEKILEVEDIQFVNNYDWLSKIDLITFLRDIGKHFTVNELIKKEAIARRLNSDVGLSYTEFAYPLLQGYDYLKLYEDFGCTLQVGGSDQWGNMVSGVDLVRRKHGASVEVVTIPLVIDKETGKKFGKSEGNAIWLAPEKTSPFAFYQFWLNTSDLNVVDYLKIYTLLSLSEIAQIEAEQKEKPEERVAQKALAKELTTLVHGQETMLKVARASLCLFGGDLESADLETKEILKNNAPTFKVRLGSSLVEVLVEVGLASSKREARTFVLEGAVQLGSLKVTDPNHLLGDVAAGELVQIKRGKKNTALLEIVG